MRRGIATMAVVAMLACVGCAGPFALVGDLAVQVKEKDSRYITVVATNKTASEQPTEDHRAAEEENTITAEACFGVAPFMLCASGDLGFSHTLLGGTTNTITVQADTTGELDAELKANAALKRKGTDGSEGN